MKVEKAVIKIKCTINGDEILNEYSGEYAYHNSKQKGAGD